jgi:hypothetical protein
MDDVPHLSLPLRIAGDRYDTVQQDTLDEARVCVAAIVAFPLGYRIEAPEFGVPELELDDRPLDVDELEAIVSELEPRVAVDVQELPYDPNDPLAARVRIEVALPGDTEEVF